MSEPYGYCFYFPCSFKTCLKRSLIELLLFWCMCVCPCWRVREWKWVWKWKWKWKFRWRTLLPEVKVTNLPLGNDKCLFMDKLGARSRGHFKPPLHPHPQIGGKCIFQGELGCQKSRSLYLPPAPPRPPPPKENEKWTSCREFSWQKSRCYSGPVSRLLLKVKKVSVFKKKRTPIDKFPIKILRFLIFQQQKVLINQKISILEKGKAAEWSIRKQSMQCLLTDRFLGCYIANLIRYLQIEVEQDVGIENLEMWVFITLLSQ